MQQEEDDGRDGPSTSEARRRLEGYRNNKVTQARGAGEVASSSGGAIAREAAEQVCSKKIQAQGVIAREAVEQLIDCSTILEHAYIK